MGLRDGETSGWAQIITEAVRYAKAKGATVLVVDTFAQFAKLTGDKENSAGASLEAMRPLQNARDEELAVLIIRHERKGGGAVTESGRGSNAISGAVEIVLQLKRPEGSHPSTHRKIEALSRFEETPSELTISLTDGEYEVLGESGAVAVPMAMNRVLESLDSAPDGKLNLKQLESATCIPRTTLQAAIDQLESDGQMKRSGSGRKNDPRVYQKNAAETPSP